MCERCIAMAREKYALLNLSPQPDPSPRDVAPKKTYRTLRRQRQRKRAKLLAAQIGA